MAVKYQGGKVVTVQGLKKTQIRTEMSRTARQIRSLITDIAAGEENVYLRDEERTMLGNMREMAERLEASLLRTAV